MKQYITFEQWREITGKQSGELIEKMGLKFNPDTSFTDFPNIGGMIEFLSNYEPDKKDLKIYRNESYLEIKNRIYWKTENDGMITQGTRSGWAIKFFYPNSWYKVDKYIESEDLCDALWEIVKEILIK